MNHVPAAPALPLELPVEQTVWLGGHPAGTRIGCDVIEDGRLQKALARNSEGFAELFFSPGERAELAAANGAGPEARFAAKESVLKALGHGLRGGLSLRHVFTERGELRLSGAAATLAGPVEVEQASSTSADHVVACVWLVPRAEDRR